jgi:predicted RNA-binding Zn ribbon-like protein
MTRPGIWFAAFALILICHASFAADPPSKAQPATVEVRFHDGSTLKLAVREEKIELQTAYGKLQIPVTEISHIEFGMRLPKETMEKIQMSIDALNSEQPKDREKAEADLLAQREKALPQLIQASKQPNKEFAKRAKEVLEKLREKLPEDLGNVTSQDVVHTEDSKFTGHVLTSEIKVLTTQFGERQLKVADLHSLRSLALAEPEADSVNVQPDPGTLLPFQGQLGKTFSFRVTGSVNGSVWGTETYTLDSTLAAVAVHMGIVQPGKTGIIKVTLIPSLPAYQGSTRNGVSSANYNVYPAGAYRVHTKNN